MRRRDFLATAALAPRLARAADARIEILLNEPIGTISPDLHGHFAEHLGGCIYDGIWVGEKSKVANIGGIRKALVDALKPLKPSVLRWPGGCFADSYDWRDGVGPRAQRPTRTNFWINNPLLQKAPDGPQKYDPNQFGTNEFIRFCRLIGAQPYLAANLRSLPPKSFYEWVEYCNAPAGATTLSTLRASQGDNEPFGVRYWGVGNESWGCGGNFAPDEYAVEYRRYIAWVPHFDVKLAFIGSGPNGADLNWTRQFFSKLVEKGPNALNYLYGWALHYYCGTSGKGQAIDFTVPDWYDLLTKADRMDSLISQHWAAMADVDKQHRVKLIVDEWGAWHKSGTEIDPAFLFAQIPTLRDALITGITLDTFHRHADKVVMANVAQLINDIHTLFLAHEDRFMLTANYHVFAMYAAHHNGQSLRTEFTAPKAAERLWGLAGSASQHDKELVLTVVNPSTSDARDAEISLRGAKLGSWRARTLTSSDIHAHITFDNPHALEPKDTQGTASGEGMPYRFPAASVTRLQIELA